MNTYGRFPLALAKGKGCWVKDTQGRRYLDAVAGIATCTLGHSDRAMYQALRKQLGRLQHVSNLYRIPEQEQLASWLVNHSCADSVFAGTFIYTAISPAGAPPEPSVTR